MQSVSSRSSIWALRRLLTLAFALALIVGGIVLVHYVPPGAVDSHQIDRHIAIGGATIAGGFLLFAVYVLTGILAEQPSAPPDGSQER